MDCQDMHLWVHGYLDGELDLSQSVAVERHLQGCASCRRLLENQRTIREQFKARELRFTPGDLLQRRVRSALKSAARAERVHPNRLAWGAAAAAVLLGTAIALSIILRTPAVTSGDDRLVSEVVSDHIRSLMANHLTDVPSSDQHTVKPWFDGKLDFSPPVKGLAGQGFPLVGGRLDYLAGRPVAALVYRYRLHYINVFIWPADKNAATAPGERSSDGYNVIHWSAAGMHYWAVSDVSPEELKIFTHLLRQSG